MATFLIFNNGQRIAVQAITKHGAAVRPRPINNPAAGAGLQNKFAATDRILIDADFEAFHGFCNALDTLEIDPETLFLPDEPD